MEDGITEDKVGFILGPALGGVLGQWGPRVPFWAAAGLSFANFLYGWLILPESLAEYSYPSGPAWHGGMP